MDENISTMMNNDIFYIYLNNAVLENIL